jgi:hypothetical protein
LPHLSPLSIVEKGDRSRELLNVSFFLLWCTLSITVYGEKIVLSSSENILPFRFLDKYDRICV